MVADMEVGERTWHINGGCGRMMRRMTDQGKFVSAERMLGAQTQMSRCL
jgi:hypothetical protein